MHIRRRIFLETKVIVGRVDEQRIGHDRTGVFAARLPLLEAHAAEVRVTKAEAGGIGGVGVWKPAESGYSPSQSTPQNEQYLIGGYVAVKT